MIIQHFLEGILEEFELNEKINITLDKENPTKLGARFCGNEIVWSEEDFINVYLIFSNRLRNDGFDVSDCYHSYYIVAKCCLAHEIGHLLDKDCKKSVGALRQIYLESDTCYDDKKQFNLLAGEFKNIKIKTEETAWEICKRKISFKNKFEELIFYKIREYALWSYYETEYCQQ